MIVHGKDLGWMKAGMVEKPFANVTVSVVSQ